MEQVEIFKALSNKTRLQILEWLKEPDKHFAEEATNPTGVCVGAIQHKAGLTQSTISEYLTILLRANLVTVTRKGQWTYYKRNEEAIKALGLNIQESL
ncbi:metalloregulator ArsR/SmtB family transcription factor [Chitinophaga oryziterrae]|uniref:Metalloregulator ArsR/SmtB family transcription factor n=1 Tax=Chitinophaga oryziterrae TaxID=1031224 RepID=A0A6N8J6C3_9BACT|nr:metalloregulator ArsR/SmtB family transcription factor [Chitinophaga oryziterrae]MVT40750.1 metalloregulator ArsR/SmtB family transcription factor [Chitinophaga oryziterrae]